MSDNKQLIDALDQIDAVIGKPELQAQQDAVLEISLNDVCKQYKQIRTFLVSVLTLIELLPGYGKKLAGAIRFLMTIADSACPTP